MSEGMRSPHLRETLPNPPCRRFAVMLRCKEAALEAFDIITHMTTLVTYGRAAVRDGMMLAGVCGWQ